jgi:hypothetical protein
MDKNQLLEALENGREQFLDLIEGLSEEELQQPDVVGDWSIKDILAHLSRWEGELVKLLWQARNGQRPTTMQLRELNPVSQESVDESNARWYAESRERPLELILADFHAVRNQTERRVEAFSEHDLSDPGRFAWLGGRPLWEWIKGDSFGHEAEHAAQIRAWLEGRKTRPLS